MFLVRGSKGKVKGLAGKAFEGEKYGEIQVFVTGLGFSWYRLLPRSVKGSFSIEQKANTLKTGKLW